MKKYLAWLLLLMPTLVGCQSVSIGPQAWFDKPMTGSTYDFPPANPVDLLVHASDPGGIKQVELRVNGNPVSTFPGSSGAETLANFTTAWSPSAPGKYTLQARAEANSGAWSGFATRC